MCAGASGHNNWGCCCSRTARPVPLCKPLDVCHPFPAQQGAVSAQLIRQAAKWKWGAVVMELRAMEALLRAPPWRLSPYMQSLLRRYQRAKPPQPGEQASWWYRVRLLLMDILAKVNAVDGKTNNRTEQVIAAHSRCASGACGGSNEQTIASAPCPWRWCWIHELSVRGDFICPVPKKPPLAACALLYQH